MAINLESIKTLDDAGFGKAVAAANALITVKNQMAVDDDLVAWASWSAEDFEALGVSAEVAATMVELMAALKACYVKIAAQDFPPNAV